MKGKYSKQKNNHMSQYDPNFTSEIIMLLINLVLFIRQQGSAQSVCSDV
jgi:hypothetical protein